MTRHIELFGHRGACAEFPENTFASFARALEVGVTTIESDVHITKDGVIVMSHDDTGMRMANVAAQIRASTFDEVTKWDVGWGFERQAHHRAPLVRPFINTGARIPSLEEFLVRYPTVPLNLDVKQESPPMVRPLLDLLAAHGALSRVTLASFHPEVLNTIRAERFTGQMVLGPQQLRRVLALPRSILVDSAGLGHRAQVPVRHGVIPFGSKWFIDKCHALGIFVDFWTINSPTEAVRLADLGADGIMTDDPARIAPALGRAGYLDAASSA